MALGGVPGRFVAPGDLGALLGAGLVYFFVNSALVSTVVGITTGASPRRVWELNFQQSILLYLFSLSIGILIAVTLANSGPLSLVLFAVPFLVAEHSFRAYSELRADLKDFVRALSEVLEEVDPYTRRHSVRVAEYSVRVARGMGLREKEVEEIECAALVHDLGKIGPVHQRIVQKPGRLTDDEYNALKAHPVVGAEIVSKVRTLRGSSAIILGHHEQPDGRGYPHGLWGNEISVGAHIVHVCDSFDAMTSDRPYRRALSVEAALRELERGAGTQFDRAVVECVMRLHASGEFALIPSPSSEDLQVLILKSGSTPIPAELAGQPVAQAA